MTARQVREVVARIIDAGHWHDGDPDILVIFDAGYDLTRLAWLLAGLPVGGWPAGSDRVLYFPVPARGPGTDGRPARHGAAVPPGQQRQLTACPGRRPGVAWACAGPGGFLILTHRNHGTRARPAGRTAALRSPAAAHAEQMVSS